MAGAQTADKAVIVSSAWGVRSVKNIKALIVLGVAVVAGLVAMYMADRYMKQQNESLAGAKVVVATKDLDLGTRLTPDMLQAVDVVGRVIDLPKLYALVSAFIPPAPLEPGTAPLPPRDPATGCEAG